MAKKTIIFSGALLILATSLHYGSPFLFDKLIIIAFICFLLALPVYSWIAGGTVSVPKTNLYVPLLALCLYSVLQLIILHPHNQRYFFESVFALALIALFLVGFYAGFGDRRNSILLLMSVLFTNSLLVIVYLAIPPWHLKTGPDAFSGWLINHNHLSMLAGMLLPYAIAMAAYKRQDTKTRVLWLASLFLLLAAFLLSVSRGGYISLMLAFSLTLLLSSWLGIFSRKTAVVLLAAAVTAGIFIMNLYPFEQRLFSNLFILSAAQRYGIWMASLRMLVSHPVSFLIGRGMGTYQDAFHRFRPADILYLINHAHNMFIEIADDLGIIGLGLCLWILLLWIADLVKGIRNTSSTLQKAVLWAGLTSTLFLLFHNFVDFGILVPSNAISAMLLFAGTASVLYADGPISGDAYPPDYFRRLSPSQRIIAAAAAGVLLSGAAAVSLRAAYGEYLYERGTKELSLRAPALPRMNEDTVQFDQAIHATRKAIQDLTAAQLYINTDLVHERLGTAWFDLFIQSGDRTGLDNAIVQFRQAQRLCPWNPYYPEDLGGLYEYKGDIAMAISATAQSLLLDPSNASLCLRMGDLELEDGRTDKAVSSYIKAGSIYPPYTWYIVPKLLAHHVDDKTVRRAADSMPDGAWVLANALIKQEGRTQKTVSEATGILKGLVAADSRHASRYLAKIVSLIPDSSAALRVIESIPVTGTDVLFYKALLQSQSGDTVSAVTGLKRVIQSDKTYRQAYVLLAGIYATHGKTEDAIHTIKQATYALPYDYGLYVELGSYYNAYNDWYNAVESYRTAVLLNPSCEQGYVQMALIYKAQGMNAQEQDIIAKGLQAVPGSKQLKEMLEKK